MTDDFSEMRAPARGQAKYRPARSGSAGKWAALVVVVLTIGASVGAVALFVPGAFRDTERHQMDSYYSDLNDEIDDLLRRLTATNAGPLTDVNLAENKVYADMGHRWNAARSKLWDDYKAKYGADPKYLKPKDRARPNPMESRYPTR